jgi:hypothetical protein
MIREKTFQKTRKEKILKKYHKVVVDNSAEARSLIKNSTLRMMLIYYSVLLKPILMRAFSTAMVANENILRIGN